VGGPFNSVLNPSLPAAVTSVGWVKGIAEMDMDNNSGVGEKSVGVNGSTGNDVSNVLIETTENSTIEAKDSSLMVEAELVEIDLESSATTPIKQDAAIDSSAGVDLNSNLTPVRAIVLTNSTAAMPVIPKPVEAMKKKRYSVQAELLVLLL